jgi:hypothetical protein
VRGRIEDGSRGIVTLFTELVSIGDGVNYRIVDIVEARSYASGG